MKTSTVLLFTFSALLVAASSANADSKTAKSCEFSKRMLLKHPHCNNLSEEATAVNCASDSDSLNKINALQARCKTQAEAGSSDMKAKLADLKNSDPSDPKRQELKKRIEAAREAKGK